MRFYPTKISLVLWADSFYGRSTYSAEEQFFRIKVVCTLKERLSEITNPDNHERIFKRIETLQEMWTSHGAKKLQDETGEG